MTERNILSSSELTAEPIVLRRFVTVLYIILPGSTNAYKIIYRSWNRDEPERWAFDFRYPGECTITYKQENGVEAVMTNSSNYPGWQRLCAWTWYFQMRPEYNQSPIPNFNIPDGLPRYQVDYFEQIAVVSIFWRRAAVNWNTNRYDRTGAVTNTPTGVDRGNAPIVITGT